MAFHVFLLVVCLLLSLALLWRLDWFPDRAFLLTRRGQAHHGATSAQAPLPRRLPGLSSGLHCLVGWGASACACTPLA
jgi:hypothetical protein